MTSWQLVEVWLNDQGINTIQPCPVPVDYRSSAPAVRRFTKLGNPALSLVESIWEWGYWWWAPVSWTGSLYTDSC